MLKNRQTYEILVPEDVGMHTSLPLGKLSGSHAVMNRLNEMGYHVNREMMVDIFPMFKAVADETDLVTPAEMIVMMQDYKKQQQKRA